MAKADIVRLTDLSLATVSEHVDLLCQAGLLREEEFGASSGGRRPKLFGFNPKAGHIIAIDLESTHMRVAVTDFGLRILNSEESFDVDVAEGPEATLTRIKDLAFSVLAKAGIDRRGIKALGIGLPGPVSFSDGLPSSLSIMPGWESYQVRDFWKKHFDCASFIDNNVYTMALGERWRDPADARETMIFVKIGNGIGAGIVCNGEVFRGATEHAGEIGAHAHLRRAAPIPARRSLPGGGPPGAGEAESLYRAVRGRAKPGPLDDDFSLLVVRFD